MMKYYLAIILFLTIARLLVVDLLNTVEKGIKLTGLSFKTLDTIGFKQCAKICVQYSACLSFNYHRKTYTCYLNQGNKTFGTGTVENDPDYEYSDVTDWKNMFSYLYSERNCVVSDRLIVLRDKFTCINTCIDSSLSAMSANMVMSSSTGRTTLYSCEENFSGYGDNRVQCLANGTWSMLNFACYPKEPKNSIVSSTNTNSATYTCKEGYIGRGINTIYFQNGNWTSLNLICFAVKDDWILVFRAMSKIGMPVLAFWENNGTGHENNYAIEKGCVSENYTDICSTHYRSILLDEWSELDVREAMVVLYKNGIPVANTTFNSIGSNRDDWFSMNNVLTSTWTDVYPGQINNVFTLNHTNPSVSRSFIMSYAYDGCPGDILWMMIAESNGVCVFDNVSPYPSFLYSPQTTKIIRQISVRETVKRHIMGLTASHVDMNSPLAQEIKQTIADHKVVIYSKTYCSYCTRAKSIFDKMDTSYKKVELDRHSDGNQIQEILSNMTGGSTVPRVFINGKFVGGCSETTSLYKSGKLQAMLQDNS